MSVVAERVAEAVRRNGPRDALCFGCLARQQGLQEHDVRAVALVLVMRRGLDVARRVCAACRRKDEVLVARHAA
jgi:hypothetical protein